MKNMNLYILKKSFKDTIPIMAGYIVLGIAFGILVYEEGHSNFIAFLMSTFIYAGSMQFVTVNLLSSGASFISSVLITLMVNARFAFYGISLLKKFKSVGSLKSYLIFGLTDETYALLSTNDEDIPNKKYYYLFVTLLNQLYWIIGTLIGSLMGASIKFDTRGIDFSMTALFVVIFLDQLLTKKDYISGLIGVLSAALCLIIFGSGNFLIPSMILITTLLLMRKLILKEVKVSEQESL